MRFSRYLERILYTPGQGYYSGPNPGIGGGGDFVTAPELSPVFGQCLARAVASALAGARGDLLELGAGNATLALSLLGALDRLDLLPERYLILEVSGSLRARQEAALAGLPVRQRERVHWIERLPEAPFHGVILGNEVADALVFDVFRITAGGPLYRGVGLAGDGAGLDWVDLPADSELRAFADVVADARGSPLPVGYVSEFRPLLAPWVRSLAERLEAGALILVDYGLPRGELYSDERGGGTLCCFSRHRAHGDPFRSPGREDVTAWVDFTSVAETCCDSGLLLEGFTTQAAFLIENGYTESVAEIADSDPLEVRTREMAAARRLVMPGDMGERFRVIAASRGLPEALPGFSGLDLTRTL
jgi:SAM-dependent MidA family methyltransferase